MMIPLDVANANVFAVRSEVTKLRKQITVLKRQLKEADKYRLTHKEWSKKYEG